jgi:16S rRNA (adenine1518-N6/adenine1519-N6)-dimethyltransferase
MNNMNKRETQLILNELGIIPNKRLGQNFLFDKNIVKKIILESQISEDEVILEIGPGLGILTEELLKLSKKVYAYEIDSKLFQYLNEKFSQIENIEIFNEDILKANIPPRIDIIVSNIPYSITGPIFEKVFYKEKPPRGILVIENNIAERIFIQNKYKNFSRITVSFNAFMKPVKKYNISRFKFFPAPRIDLSLIIVKPRENINPFLLSDKNKSFFLKFIAGIMPYKNKNIVNAINLFLKNEKVINFPKPKILQYLKNKNINNDKVTKFKVDDLVNLSKLIFELIYETLSI